MHEDLKIFIKKIVKSKEKYKDCTIFDIGIRIDGEWYDYTVYFTYNNHNTFTTGSIKICDFNKYLRREKLEKLKM